MTFKAEKIIEMINRAEAKYTLMLFNDASEVLLDNLKKHLDFLYSKLEEELNNETS